MDSAIFQNHLPQQVLVKHIPLELNSIELNRPRLSYINCEMTQFRKANLGVPHTPPPLRSSAVMQTLRLPK